MVDLNCFFNVSETQTYLFKVRYSNKFQQVPDWCQKRRLNTVIQPEQGFVTNPSCLMCCIIDLRTSTHSLHPRSLDKGMWRLHNAKYSGCPMLFSLISFYSLLAALIFIHDFEVSFSLSPLLFCAKLVMLLVLKETWSMSPLKKRINLINE